MENRSLSCFECFECYNSTVFSCVLFTFTLTFRFILSRFLFVQLTDSVFRCLVVDEDEDVVAVVVDADVVVAVVVVADEDVDVAVDAVVDADVDAVVAAGMA